MKHFALLAGVGLAALIAAAPTQAGIVNGIDFGPSGSLAPRVIDGINWTIAPNTTFQLKTSGSGCVAPFGCSGGGYVGVGIGGGRTNDEIDLQEVLDGAFGPPRTVTSLTLGVLYDGPEFGDFQEVAQVTFRILGGSDLVHTLTNLFDANTNAVPAWTGPGTVTEISDDESSHTATDGAVWHISGFNIHNVIGVGFTALPGTCGVVACTNQSDFTLVQLVTAVPEPASLALLGAGLLGLGFAARRRKAA